MKSLRPVVENVPLLIRTIAVAVCAIVIAAGCSRITALAEFKPPPELGEAKTYLSAGDRDRAVAKFNAAITAAPKDPRVYGEILSISAHTGQRDLVDRYYREAVEASRSLTADQKASVHYLAGYAYLHLRDFDRAIQANSKAVELAPDSIHGLNGLGYSYAEAKRELPKAVELITRAIQLAREQNIAPHILGAIIDSLGWAYYQQGKYEEALKTLSEAASLSPSMAEIQYHLGLAYEANNRLKEARIAHSRATVRAPGMAMYRQALDRVTASLKALGELEPESGAPVIRAPISESAR